MMSGSFRKHCFFSDENLFTLVVLLGFLAMGKLPIGLVGLSFTVSRGLIGPSPKIFKTALLRGTFCSTSKLPLECGMC